MRRSDLTIGLITDEVSPSLDEGLAFAREEGIGTVDLRVVDESGKEVPTGHPGELVARGTRECGALGARSGRHQLGRNPGGWHARPLPSFDRS